MEEDEEAILEAMDAEDAAAAEVENDEKIGDKENTKTEGIIWHNWWNFLELVVIILCEIFICYYVDVILGDPNKTAEKNEKPTKVCHICGHKAQSYVSLRNHIMAR